jgi:succinate dehydrogenase / fumarate reductase membrane anchor subunit
MSLRTPIGRVLGLGSAKSGVSHWWSQRVSAVALAILALWFVCALLRMPDFTYATLIAWIAVPFNAVLLALLTGVAAYHSKLGVQVVVEDYVHDHGWKVATLLVINFIHAVLAACGIFAVLRIAFLGAGIGAAV